LAARIGKSILQDALKLIRQGKGFHIKQKDLILSPKNRNNMADMLKPEITNVKEDEH
jgi:hypothetical protein